MNKVISTERLPIKLWLNDIEDEALDQARNLANLPFASKHIAIMPDSHLGYGMPIGGVLATKSVIIPNAVGVDIGCFTGDTKIPLLDGKDYSLKELFNKRIKNFPVYSMNKNGKYVIGIADEVKLTRKNANLVKITLDNGKIITCTPDHQFLTRKLQYIQAKNLTKKHSLMPFHRLWDKDGYEILGIRASNNNIKTHWVVAQSGLLGEIPEFKNETIIHHKNNNPRMNYPHNLEFKDKFVHLSEHATKRGYFKTKEFQEKRLNTFKQRGYTFDPKFQDKKSKVAAKNIMNYMNNNPDHYATVVKKNGQRGSLFFTNKNSDPKMIKKQKLGRIKKIVLRCLKDHGKVTEESFNLTRKNFYNCQTYNKAKETIKNYGMAHLEEVITIEPYSRKKHSINHRIKKIELLRKKQDVYCLTVDKYHNFALSSGIFVHNCGMCVVKTNLRGIGKESLKSIMSKIRQVIPVGFNKHKEPKMHKLMPDTTGLSSLAIVRQEYENARKSLGTLGGGNHFLEFQQDTDNFIWIMIHSGSRNLGYKVAVHYNNVAKEMNKKWHSSVLDKWELAFLPIDSQEGQDYIKEMQYCIDFALANRKEMMDQVKTIIALECYEEFIELMGVGEIDSLFSNEINIAHNYASLENHFGQNVWVHRKGATLARKDTIGIIPGSQGTASYIVKGLGNPESFMSCSHGAGRTMSRTKARNELNLIEEQKKLDDQDIIHSIRNQKDLDEASSAYKDIDEVMKNQDDLVEILVKLRPLAVIKG